VNTSSPKRIPAIPDMSDNDQASYLIAAALETLQKVEEMGEGPETLLSVIQAHTLLGVAAEKLQAPS